MLVCCQWQGAAECHNGLPLWLHSNLKDDDLYALHVGLCCVKWSVSNCSAWNLLNLARSLLI